jgi:hypothetical protein
MNPNHYDLGALFIAIRNVLPTNKLTEFEDLLYRAALSPHASEAFRWAMNIEPRESAAHHPFEVITGGAA